MNGGTYSWWTMIVDDDYAQASMVTWSPSNKS